MTSAAVSTPWAGTDYGLVRELREHAARRVREQRQQYAQAGTPLDPATERTLGWDIVAETIRDTATDDPAELAALLHAELWGGGRLQRLMDEPTVSQIRVTGPEHVRITMADGEEVDGPPVADSRDDLVTIVRRLATRTGDDDMDVLTSQSFDPAHPHLKMRLPGGHRLSAWGWLCPQPSLLIRCYRPAPVTLADLHSWGGFSDEVGAFLTAAVRARANLLVSGATYTGKTTMLRALCSEIADREPIITVEAFRELGLADLRTPGDVLELEARPRNSDGKGEWTLGDIVPNLRHHSPGRVIVGEVLGEGEVLPMFDVMTQGEGGSMSTVHASSAEVVFRRLARYALPTGLPMSVCHASTADAVDFVIHLEKRTETSGAGRGRIRRYVAGIREVVSTDGRQVMSSEVFAPAPGLSQAPRTSISQALGERLAAEGYDPAQWSRR